MSGKSCYQENQKVSGNKKERTINIQTFALVININYRLFTQSTEYIPCLHYASTCISIGYETNPTSLDPYLEQRDQLRVPSTDIEYLALAP